MLELMDRLKDAGATEAAIVCTHGLFAGKAVERLRDHPFVTEVVTTDTVPAPDGWPELKVRSVSALFAEAISRIHHGRSVSSLFEGVDPTHAPPQAKLPFDTHP
jgi:ribose-phosphate pyrophosphokinase